MAFESILFEREKNREQKNEELLENASTPKIQEPENSAEHIVPISTGKSLAQPFPPNPFSTKWYFIEKWMGF